MVHQSVREKHFRVRTRAPRAVQLTAGPVNPTLAITQYPFRMRHPSHYRRYALLFCLVGTLLACSDRQPAAGTATTADRPAVRLKYTSAIRAILEDSRGNIWFGSHAEGVARYDGEGLTYFTVADGLSSPQVRSIHEDAAGLIWFEGGEGLSSFDGEVIAPRSERDYSQKHAWEKAAGDLWFKGDQATGYSAAEGGPGVYRYGGDGLAYHLFPLDVPDAGDNYYSVSTPFQTGQDGTVWFGTYGAAIGYDGASFTVIDGNFPGLIPAGGDLHIRSLLADSQGNLWIGNNGIGVLRYDGDSTQNFSVRHGLLPAADGIAATYGGSPNNLSRVFAIGEDRQGHIWFGDRDTGAWRYDGESLTNYGLQDGLTVTHIWQIYRSRTGELWFALEDGSVSRFDGSGFTRIF